MPKITENNNILEDEKISNNKDINKSDNKKMIKIIEN